jgi:hypothetical protein
MSPQPDLPRFDVEPYRDTRPLPVGGTLALLLGMSAAGLAVGSIASFVAQWFYLAVIFPLGMGLLAGGAGQYLVRMGKARGRLACGLAAVLTGVVTILAFHFGGFLRELAVAEPQAPGTRARALRDPAEFVRYVERRAEEGVTVGGSLLRRAKPMRWRHGEFYVYWGLEALVVTLAAVAPLRLASAVPPCERCGRWQEERPLGLVPHGPADEVTGPLRAGELLALLAAAAPPGDDGLLLKAAVCPGCGAEAPVVVSLERRKPDAKGRTDATPLDRVRYPGAVLPFLDARAGRA